MALLSQASLWVGCMLTSTNNFQAKFQLPTWSRSTLIRVLKNRNALTDKLTNWLTKWDIERGTYGRPRKNCRCIFRSLILAALKLQSVWFSNNKVLRLIEYKLKIWHLFFADLSFMFQLIAMCLKTYCCKVLYIFIHQNPIHMKNCTSHLNIYIRKQQFSAENKKYH